MVVLNICVCCIVLLIGFNLKKFYSDFSIADRNILNQIYFYHIIISIAFHFFIFSFGGDARHYWEQASVMPLSEILLMVKSNSPSGIIFLLNYFPANILKLSLFVGNMMYSVLGYFGFILLYRICKTYFGNFESLAKVKIFHIKLFPWILFLPNLHFWSAGIGKDVILFTCVIAIVYGLLNIRKRIVLIIISMVLSFVIRPHITLFLISALGFGFIFDKRLKRYHKIIITIGIIIGMYSIFDYVLKFAQLDSFTTEVIEEYSNTKAVSLNQERAGSGIDMRNYSFPAKVFTFIYRPLFFDVNNFLGFIASMENLILLVLTFRVIKSKPISAFRKFDFLQKGSLIFFLIGATAFSLLLGNLGIMLRQKNMFVPLFIFFSFSVFHRMYLNEKKIS